MNLLLAILGVGAGILSLAGFFAMLYALFKLAAHNLDQQGDEK